MVMVLLAKEKFLVWGAQIVSVFVLEGYMI